MRLGAASTGTPHFEVSLAPESDMCIALVPSDSVGRADAARNAVWIEAPRGPVAASHVAAAP
jgi:hypothetical protein